MDQVSISTRSTTNESADVASSAFGGIGQPTFQSTADKDDHEVPAVNDLSSAMQQLAAVSLGGSQETYVEKAAVGCSKSSSGVATVASPAVSPNNDADTSNTDMANTKEKTPMCLINELARFNKIPHQYHLTDEDGPAHNKTFTVLLRLGDEEYRASGSSIKRTQQAAAGDALTKTNYKQRPPKSGRVPSQFACNLTPTVELNALAMKRGEPAVYTVLEQSRTNHRFSPPNFNFRGAYNQRYHYPQCPRPCSVSLRVGSRAFIGEGASVQIARHNAAEKALLVLQNLPVQSMLDHADRNKENEAGAANGVDGDDADGVTSTSVGPGAVSASVAAATDEVDGGGGGGESDELKSPISLVHEIALKRHLSVDFQVTRESGPPHMRTFLTKCLVGDMFTEGEGNAKKLSKKRAAERMLEELKKLPPLPPSPAALKLKKKKKNPVKKKNRNLIKEQKANPEYGQGINPISRLIQIQQAKHEKEPVYSLVAEGGVPRRREFVMRVQVGEQSCRGIGQNKKFAKRAAAEALLQALGYSRPVSSIDPACSSIASNKSSAESDSDNEKPRKVTFLDADAGIGVIGDKCDGEGRSGRQLVPGLLLMPEVILANESLASLHSFHQHQLASGQSVGVSRTSGRLLSIQDSTITAIAKELLLSGLSPTAEAISKSGPNDIAGDHFLSPKHQLAYLADVLGLTVQFTDFPRGNKREFLSLVSLSTNPPQVSHGAGETLEESHDEAAVTALRALAGLGVNSYSKKDLAAVDGMHVGPSQNGTSKLIEPPTGVVGELPNNVC